MGITKTADGRYQVGKGIADANNYTGALGKRDMVIQYTEDGVTAQSMDYLNFLKDYAEHHADIGELIKPSDVSIWIAKDDKLTAVEADDISYDDGTFTLSSITYDGTDWTFGEPTPGGGGGGGVPTPTAEDVGKALIVEDSSDSTEIIPSQVVTVTQTQMPVALQNADTDYLMAMKDGDTATIIVGDLAYDVAADWGMDGGAMLELMSSSGYGIAYLPEGFEGLAAGAYYVDAVSTGNKRVELLHIVSHYSTTWGGITLPTYDEFDEGKTLKIVNGVPQWANDK